jgi:hypothetical protein
VLGGIRRKVRPRCFLVLGPHHLLRHHGAPSAYRPAWLHRLPQNPAAVHGPWPRPEWRRQPAAAAGGSMAGTDMRGCESSGAGAGLGDEAVAWPAVMARCGGSGISGDDAWAAWVSHRRWAETFLAGGCLRVTISRQASESSNAEGIVDALRVPAAATLSVNSVMRTSWICRF